MVTEADWASWTPADLRPYVDRVLEMFGPDRLLFGSDWPVCLLAATLRARSSTRRDRLLDDLAATSGPRSSAARRPRVYRL